MDEKRSKGGGLRGLLPFLGKDKPLVNVIALEGAIGTSATPLRGGLSLASLEKTIEKAFKPKRLDAVALAINSPGGSPVQSRLIFRAIRRKAAERDVPVLAFIEDVGASGGYILACAGDEIYADESSIVGSIGVIAGGFGFVEAIDKLGVERRVHTAGDNKSMLDPFRPEDPKDVDRLKSILHALHEQFIALVEERREGRLDPDPVVFSGAFWAGPRARELGLVDDIGQLGDVVRARFGDDVEVKRVAGGGAFLKKIVSRARPGALIDWDEALGAIERRALWSRYGA